MGVNMSVPLRNDGLSRKEEMNVSAAAMSEVPWVPAVAAGAAVAGADLVLHAVTGHIGLSPIASSISAGSVALFAVAGGGAMVRNRSSRALRWARANPWRFALVPGIATAAIVFVLSIVLGSGGLFGDIFTSLWHGAIAYGITGGVGTVFGPRDKRR
jgi:hypothetical protein